MEDAVDDLSSINSFNLLAYTSCFLKLEYLFIIKENRAGDIIIDC